MYMPDNGWLILFPHAGGLACSYQKLARLIRSAAGVEVTPYEYAGRGEKTRQEPYKDFTEAVGEVMEDIRENYPAQRYYFYGHSMGGYFALEVARRMQQEGSEVSGVFISGVTAPDYRQVDNSEINDNNIIHYLQIMESLPDEIMAKESLRELYMRIIRNDFLLMNSYRNTYNWDQPFQKLVVLYGVDDPVMDLDKMEEWAELPADFFDMVPYAGKHFFLFDQEERISRDLAGWM